MVEGLHAVVRLLLARMKSHPREFRQREGFARARWEEHINDINTYGNETDKAAILAGIRDIRLAEIHEQVMEELLNGPERRRKEEEGKEHERQSMQDVQQLSTPRSRRNQLVDTTWPSPTMLTTNAYSKAAILTGIKK